MVTPPPILMQPSLPGILTNPAPYAPQEFPRLAGTDLANFGGGGGVHGEVGLFGACANAVDVLIAANIAKSEMIVRKMAARVTDWSIRRSRS